jgi:hypothetical protein
MNFLVDYLKLIDLLALIALAALACAALVRNRSVWLFGGNFGGNLGRHADHGLALKWLIA